MAQHFSEAISRELGELFDLRTAKVRNEKRLTQEATEAQKDIRLVTLMFRDGIPDLEIEIGAGEKMIWDSKAQALIFQSHGHDQLLEGASREARIKVRPHLKELVKKAKELYI